MKCPLQSSPSQAYLSLSKSSVPTEDLPQHRGHCIPLLRLPPPHNLLEEGAAVGIRRTLARLRGAGEEEYLKLREEQRSTRTF